MAVLYGAGEAAPVSEQQGSEREPPEPGSGSGELVDRAGGALSRLAGRWRCGPVSHFLERSS